MADDALPAIAVVTPSFEQGEFLERTIRSVVSQGYPRLRYAVQDGGSRDGSVAILERWAPRLDSWVSARDGGQADAVNRGFAGLDGEVMAWLNSDDLLLPGTLRVVGEFFARHPDIDVVYGNRIVIDDDDRDIGRWILPGHDQALLAWVDYVPQETLFWRRRVWTRSAAASTSRSATPSTGTCCCAFAPPAPGSPICRGSSARSGSTARRRTRR